VNRIADPITKLYEGLDAESLDEVKHHRTPVMRFRASEMADCGRRIWYRLSGYLPTPDSAWLDLIGKEGNVLHDVVRHLCVHHDMPLSHFELKEDGTVQESPIMVKQFTYDDTDFTMSCRDDGHAELSVGMAALELKTLGFYYYKYLSEAYARDGDQGVLERIQAKHKNYVAQGNTTAMLHDLDWVYLLVVARENMTVGLYDKAKDRRTGGAIWRVTDEAKNKLLAKCARIQRHVTSGRPPIPEYLDGSKECGQCPFYYRCHGAARRKIQGEEPTVVYPVPGIMESTK